MSATESRYSVVPMNMQQRWYAEKMLLLTNTKKFRRKPCVVLLALTLLFPGAAALADDFDTVNLILSETLAHDDNLFRLPANVDPTPSTGKSDRSSEIRIDSIGIKLNKSYSQQRLHFETSIDRYRYSNYNFLDFLARNASMGWDFALTPNLTGTVSGERTQTLNSFADYRNFSSRNVRTNNNRYFGLDYLVMGGWHLVTAVDRYSSIGEDALIAVEDQFKATSTQAGVKYVFGSSSSITYLARRQNGSYPQGLSSTTLSDIGFRQHDREIQAKWLLSGQTVLNARFTNIDRHHLNFSQRDYSGNTGRVGLIWKPTGKTTLTIDRSKEFSSYQTNYANYIATDSFAVSPSWQITGKTSLTMHLIRGRRNYLGAPFGAVPLMRQDKQHTAQLELSWNATRNIDVTADLQHDNRKSTFPGLDFVDNTASINLHLNF